MRLVRGRVGHEAEVGGETNPSPIPGVVVAVERAGVVPRDQGGDLLIVIDISFLPKPGSILSVS